MPPNGHDSVVWLTRHWYVACQSSELKRRPLARRVLGIPLVLYRDASDEVHALLDRCPHRNVPLSLGSVSRAGHLECIYHGWQFDGIGRCRVIPGHKGETDTRSRRCSHVATREQEGLVWVYGALDEPSEHEPYRLGLDQLTNHTIAVRQVEAEATLHATVENALDVPHTTFLHRGLFRGAERQPVKVRVKRSAHSVEAEYIGEKRPSGLVARLLSPAGGIVEHWDRFILPSIAQVEYRLGNDSHFVVTALCTPIDDFRTRLTAVAAFRTPLPGAVLRPLLTWLGLRIFAQDARVLKAQTATIREFGGEQFAHTDQDILGPHITWLLKHSEQGDTNGSNFERESTLWG
jgi:phenylpropionate dioxygenase-like ring-hydroxylating dioxygenase large terminal subunit